MFFVYFNAQVISFHEHATPYECVRLPGHEILYPPFALGQLQTLFTSDGVAKFSADTFKGTIRIVRVLDDEWSRKSIIELSDESWNHIRLLIDWADQVELTDNSNSVYRKRFTWLFHDIGFWMEWVGRELPRRQEQGCDTDHRSSCLGNLDMSRETGTEKLISASLQSSVCIDVW